MKLLSEASSNAKTAKNKRFSKYLSYILHLAPSNLSGYNTCPKASKGCRLACLNTAGRGVFNSVQTARRRKTYMLFQEQERFFELLNKDLQAVQRKALKLKRKAVVRLNGTSDLNWLNLGGRNIIAQYPDIQFYDYTKVVSRLKEPLPSNYHLTFSRSESNHRDCLEALKLGFNVAVVFKGKPSPWVFKELGPLQIVDGDTHDLRFKGKRSSLFGSIIALSAKGKAKRDSSGFVVNNILEFKGVNSGQSNRTKQSDSSASSKVS